MRLCLALPKFSAFLLRRRFFVSWMMSASLSTLCKAVGSWGGVLRGCLCGGEGLIIKASSCVVTRTYNLKFYLIKNLYM